MWDLHSSLHSSLQTDGPPQNMWKSPFFSFPQILFNHSTPLYLFSLIIHYKKMDCSTVPFSPFVCIEPQPPHTNRTPRLGVKMRGLFGFSIVEFVKKRKRARWISLGLEPKKIQLSNGTELHCWVLKNNPHREKQRPTFLLIHGFGADAQMGWDDQICALGKHFDLLIPDLIFSGESTTTSTERSEIFQAECLKSMVDSLGVDSVIAVGHSYGGFVAYWMAHKYPNLVRRLVIISSAICMTPSTTDPLLKAFGASNVKDFLLPNDARDLKRAMNLTLYKMPWLPAFLYTDLLQTMGGNKEQKTELLDELTIGTTKSQPLPTVTQDVLLVWGEKDLIFPLEEAYILQRHIGEKAKLVVIKECGHVASLEKPTELNETLLKFMSLDN